MAAGGGGRAGRRILVAVLVLVVVLVVGDRVANYVAEQQAASTIKTSQHLPADPDVSIGGFPFLNQLATGHYDEITVTAKDVPLSKAGLALQVSRVQVVLHHLTVSRSFSRVRAATANATAVITYADLSHTLGLQLSYAGGGRVKASKTVTIAGHSLTATLSARPQLADETLSFGAVAINQLGAIGSVLTKTLTKAFDLTIPLQGIPFDVRVRSLQVGAQGLVIVLTGSNLVYQR